MIHKLEDKHKNNQLNHKQQQQQVYQQLIQERNKKLNRRVFHTFLNVIIGTIDFNFLIVDPLFVFVINSRCIDNCGGGNDVTGKKFVVLEGNRHERAGKQQQMIMATIASVKAGLNETSDSTRHGILLTSNETKEKKITKYVNYSQWIIIDCISFYNNGLFDACIQIIFVLY